MIGVIAALVPRCRRRRAGKCHTVHTLQEPLSMAEKSSSISMGLTFLSRSRFAPGPKKSGHPGKHPEWGTAADLSEDNIYKNPPELCSLAVFCASTFVLMTKVYHIFRDLSRGFTQEFMKFFETFCVYGMRLFAEACIMRKRPIMPDRAAQPTADACHGAYAAESSRTRQGSRCIPRSTGDRAGAVHPAGRKSSAY